MRGTLIVGGSRDARVAAAADLLEREAPGAARVRLAADALPFVRQPLSPSPAARRAVVLHDAERAFPDRQGGGPRLVLTQSSYSMQALLDALGADDLLVATADRDALAHEAPEALAGRGPWAEFELVDLAQGGAGRASGDAVREARHEGGTAALLARAYRSPSAAERLRLCEEAAEETPGSEVAWLALAGARREGQDAAGARRALDRALAIAPDWAAAHYEDGKLWLAAEDLERAAGAFARASACMPSFSAAAGNLGATLGELDRPEEALAAFTRALAHDPRNFTILNNIGVVTRELGRLDDSSEACRRVIALAPDFVFGYYNLGHTRFLAGAYDEALAAYEEGQRRDPEKNRRQGCRLAVVRFASGDVAGAERDLRRFAGAAPRDEREDLLLEAYEAAAALLERHPERAADRVFLERIAADITRPPQS